MFMGSFGLPSSVPSVTIEPGTMPTENALLSPFLLPLFILLRKHFKQEWLDMEFGMTAKIFYLFVFQLWWAIVKLAMEVEHLVFMFTSKAMKKWVVPLRKFELWILEDSLMFPRFYNNYLKYSTENSKAKYKATHSWCSLQIQPYPCRKKSLKMTLIYVYIMYLPVSEIIKNIKESSEG